MYLALSLGTLMITSLLPSFIVQLSPSLSLEVITELMHAQSLKIHHNMYTNI